MHEGDLPPDCYRDSDRLPHLEASCSMASASRS